jgi:hypothetical protein
MSTLRVNTIQDSTGSSSPAINGLARAWVNFNGTGTVAIRASLNVSSITDNGTGYYAVNFINAMPDANYSLAHSAGSGTTQGSHYESCAFPQNTTSAWVYGQWQGTAYDLAQMTLTVFR